MASDTIFRLFQRGRFYDFTVYTDPRTGQPIFRARKNAKGKGIRYLSQQMTRDRMAQLPARYRAMMPLIGEAFTRKSERESNYNAFVSENFRMVTTWLTKEEVDLGAAILEPMVISTGLLGEIVYQYTEDEQHVVTDIELKGLTEITAETTIGEFSRAITPKQSARIGRYLINHNEAMNTKVEFVEHDELYFWRLHQELRGDVPVIWAKRVAVELDNNSDVPLIQQLGGSLDGFEVLTVVRDGSTHYYLACSVQTDTSVAWVHSTRRREYLKSPKDKVALSNQVTLGQSSLVTRYSSNEALLKAVESYGGVNRDNYSAPSPNMANDPEEDTGNTGPTVTTQVTLTSSVVGSGGTVAPASTTVDQGATVTFTATPNSGKRVKRWSTGATGNTLTVTASESRAYTVEFEDIPSGGGGGDLG